MKLDGRFFFSGSFHLFMCFPRSRRRNRFAQMTKVGMSVAESKLIKGAAVLAAAAVVSKLLGTLQKIPLQNIAGDEAFGIYNAVYPFYTFILLLATAGIPVAVSKFVSESMEKRDVHLARRLTIMACGLLTLTGLAFCLLLFFGAEILASWIGSTEVALSIQSVSFALIFVPVMAVLRGYFQGKQEMAPTAVSQVLEQTVRVATMIALLFVLTSKGAGSGIVAAGAVFGSVAGAAAGFAWMLRLWMKELRNHPVSLAASRKSEDDARQFKALLLYAMPVCFGSLMMPLLTAVDSFTLPRLLAARLERPEEALAQFGIYTRGLPLVQLVSMIFSSVAVALVPAVSEAKLRGKILDIERRTELSLRLTWWIASAAMVGLIITVKPINVMFYTNDDGSAAMAILSLTIVFSAVQIVSTSILQGLGHAKLPALYLAAAAAVKVIFNLLLVPRWGIEGAALSAVITFFVAAALNMQAVFKYVQVRLNWNNYVLKPAAALGLMACSLWLILTIAPAVMSSFALHARLEQTMIALTAVAAGAIVYIISGLHLGLISAQEWKMVPKLHNKLQRLLPWLK